MDKNQKPGTSKQPSKPFGLNMISFSYDHFILRGGDQKNVPYSPRKDKVELMRLNGEKWVREVETNMRLKFYQDSVGVRQGLYML